MSIFNKIFGDSNSKGSDSDKMKWIDLTNLSQLEDIISLSQQKPVVIFKHSTRCSVSRMALKQFEREYDLNEEQVIPYFLDLLSHRDISNAIAERFNIVHESPQLLLIKEGKVIYNSSHSDIDAEILKGRIITS